LKDIQQQEAQQQEQLRRQQEQEQHARLVREVQILQQQQQQPSLVSGSGTWSADKSKPKASLREIMEAEAARLQEEQKADGSSPRPSAGSWAAKAGTGAPLSNSPRAVAPVVATSQSRPAPTAVQVVGRTAPGNSGQSQQRPSSTKSSETQSKKGATSSADQGSGSFGQNLSPELSDWCSAQLKKINSSDSLTLMEFCMTLESPVEIREYLAAYLGSTPQVLCAYSGGILFVFCSNKLQLVIDVAILIILDAAILISRLATTILIDAMHNTEIGFSVCE
jgi:hypothetical protein